MNFDHEREVINETSTKTANVDSDRESHTCTTQQYLPTQGREKWNTSSTQTVHLHSLGTRAFYISQAFAQFWKEKQIAKNILEKRFSHTSAWNFSNTLILCQKM